MSDHDEVKATLEALSDVNPSLSAAELTGHLAAIFSERKRTVIPFIRKYAIEIVAAIGYITSIATALGLSRQHYVSVVLGVLSTVAVILTKFFTVTKPAAKAAAK